MQQSELENPIKSDPNNLAHSQLRPYPDRDRRFGAEQSRSPHRPVPSGGRASAREVRLMLVMAAISLGLVVWFILASERASSPTSSEPSTGATSAYLGILYLSSNVLAGSNQVNGAQGLVITEIKPDSPAQKAGLQAGDLITSLGGRAVQSDASLLALLANHQPGETVQVDFLRNGRLLIAFVTLK